MSCESGLRRRESGLGLNRFVSSSSWRAVSCLSNVRLILRHVVPPQGYFDCIGQLLKQVCRQEIEGPASSTRRAMSTSGVAVIMITGSSSLTAFAAASNAFSSSCGICRSVISAW